MSSALKPKRIDSDEEEEDRIEYIEVKKNSEIKAILKAEQATKQTPQNHPTPIHNDKKEEKEEKSAPVDKKEKKERRFIKDDREREYPQQREKKQDLSKKQSPPTGTSQGQIKPKKEQLPKQQDEESNERRQKRRKSSSAEKKVLYVQKQQSKEETILAKREKYVQKKEKQTKARGKIQLQVQNGEEVQVQLLQEQQPFENHIFIWKKSIDDYLYIANKLLKRFDFIQLNAFGNNVSKALLVAGYLAEDHPQLKQINIPRTVQVRETFRKQEKTKTRGAISIQLSLTSLRKQHIGYQQSSSKPQQKRYNEKPQQGRRYKEKENEKVDERALR